MAPWTTQSRALATSSPATRRLRSLRKTRSRGEFQLSKGPARHVDPQAQMAGRSQQNIAEHTAKTAKSAETKLFICIWMFALQCAMHCDAVSMRMFTCVHNTRSGEGTQRPIHYLGRLAHAPRVHSTHLSNHAGKARIVQSLIDKTAAGSAKREDDTDQNKTERSRQHNSWA